MIICIYVYALLTVVLELNCVILSVYNNDYNVCMYVLYVYVSFTNSSSDDDDDGGTRNLTVQRRYVLKCITFNTYDHHYPHHHHYHL